MTFMNDPDNKFPLSLPQMDIYLDQLCHPYSPLYNIGGYIECKNLDLEKVLQAQRALVSSCEFFRIQISDNEDGAYQYIEKKADAEFRFVDFSLSPTPLDTANHWLHETFETSYDFENANLFRCWVVKVEEQVYWLVGLAHHLVIDGWGFSNWAKKLAEYYTSSEKDFSELEDVYSWKNIVLKNGQYPESPQYEKDKVYWRDHCASVNKRVFHAHYADRFHYEILCSQRYSINIPRNLFSKITRFSKGLGVAPPVFFLGLLAKYFSSVYGRESWCFGIPVHNRRNRVEKEMLGIFTGISPLVLKIDQESRFADFLVKISRTQKENYRHQRYPLGHIIRDAASPVAGESFYDVMFNYLKLDDEALDFDGESTELTYVSNGHQKNPLSITVWDGGGDNVEMQFDYRQAYFADKEIELLGVRLRHLLEVFLEKPESLLKDVCVIPDNEKNFLLWAVNSTSTKCPQETHIHAFFEAQVKRTPQATALIFEHQQLSYQGLNERANQLAHYLVRERQVKPDTLVGVCLERSLEMVVAILGILKAGGAYVPLDPAYPEARLAHMIEDAELKTVITHSTLLKESPIDTKQALCLDAISTREMLNDQPKSNPNSESFGLTTAHLAYVIYTSGSTGKPKGVMLQHSNASAFIAWALDTYTPTQLTCVLASTSYSFDLSIFELFVPLAAGGQALIVKDILALQQCLHAEKNITLINTVPSAAKALLSSGLLPQTLPVLNLAGELLRQDLVEQLYAAGVGLVYDLYGPSEDTTYSTYALRKVGGTSNIGRPLHNTQAYIFDAEQQLVPSGVAGELHLGGAGLARGYLNRVELTSEKFIANPFYKSSNSNSSERLYKTGDLVRWLPDGNLEYLGRLDHQVKIRGFRIELGEIENALNTHVSVKDVIVQAKGEDIDKRLVAYIVTEAANERGLIKPLQQYLGQQLPAHMMPSAFVFLDAMPLTPNGKIDRKALPEPNVTDQQAVYVAPSTELERTLCTIWQEVLDVESVGANDNFFQLAGHSLLATRLVARINQHLKIDLSLKNIFLAGNVAQLAGLIEISKPNCRQPAITRVGRDIPLAVSYAQQRLWMLDRIDGGSAHYNMPAVLALRGAFNYSAFNRAFKSIIERHESLRTCFWVGENGEPNQKVLPITDFAVEVQDLSALEKAERSKIVEQEIKAEAAQIFNLHDDLMVRVRLLKTSDEAHILLVTLHHIAADGWSMTILINEFRVLYQAYSQGQENPLPRLKIQYADYAHWQRNWLQGNRLKQQLDYWEQQLIGLPVVHSLPLNYPRPKFQSFSGAILTTEIGKHTAADLLKFCHKYDATLFMGLHTVFSVLLARYSNESDIVVGSPIANREQAEIQGLIGFFVNNLVLRSDLSNNPCFEDALKQSKKTLLDAFSHQQVPFEQLVERLQPERSLNHSPLFQVMLVLQNNEAGTLELPGLTLNIIESPQRVAKYDLTLTVIENQDENGLSLEWEYNTDLFSSTSIERMASHFEILLGRLLKLPGDGVFDLDLLSDSEKQQQLLEWSGTSCEFSQSFCVHTLFEAQVKNNPGAIALVFEDQQLSYQQLNDRANQLAHYLANQKYIKPDTLVGICFERSLEMVVAILGILKAGGAYVPLDPAYPEARLASMIEDACLDIVITRTNLMERIPIADTQAVCLDSKNLLGNLAQQSKSNLAPEHLGLTAKHLTYVIYTSGSTGMPKGVMVEHSAFAFHIARCQIEYSLQAADQVLQFAAITFDAAQEQIFAALAAGATLFIRPQELWDAPGFYRYVRERGITLVDLPPSYGLQLLAESVLSAELQDLPLRTMILGGEALSVELVRHWKQQELSFELINAYGPTEAVVTSTRYNFSNYTLGEHISIGRPLPGTQCYVLNHLQLVPQGVAGELHLGGPALARGYLNRPELTAEKFIDNPFHDPNIPSSSKRLYKTGDLVRWLPDGNLEFLGRIDQQVKIRGFRIELGEIENILAAHELIKDAIVQARKSVSGHIQLVGYIIADEKVCSDQVSDYLGKELPDYMVPSAFVFMGAWPLTPSGKVDQKALPEPDISDQQNTFAAPRNDIERSLCAIWQVVLEMEKVGINDNFFRLGGHSLLLIKLIHLVAEKYSIQLSARDVFQAPTVSEMAVALEREQLESSYPPLCAREESGPSRLSYAQYRVWFVEKLRGRTNENNIACALTIDGNLKLDLLEEAVNKVVARHDILRTRFLEIDGEPCQVVDPTYHYHIELEDLSSLPPAERKEQAQNIVEQQATQVFDLSKLPLLSIFLIKEADNQFLLNFNQHHIISDGWSQQLFYDELMRIYQGLLNGNTIDIPAPRFTYADYSSWQHRWLESDQARQQKEFWKNYLLDCRENFSLPMQGRKAESEISTREVSARIPADLVNELKTVSNRVGGSLFNILHSVFSVLLSRLSGETDFNIGIPVAGRHVYGTNDILGMFLNNLPLRNRVDLSWTFEALLKQQISNVEMVLSNQDIPFEQILEVAACERSLGSSPLFQVFFNMLSIPENDFSDEKLDFEYSLKDRVEIRTKFDLTLYLSESKDGLDLYFSFDQNIYSTNSINVVLEQYVQLLKQVALDSTKPSHEYSLNLGKYRINQEWPIKRFSTFDVTALFRHQAQLKEQSIAVIDEFNSWTYQRLLNATFNIAHKLQSKNIDRGDVVTIVASRETSLVIAIMASLQTGAAYCVVTPDMPLPRVKQQIQIAGSKIVLFCEPLAKYKPEFIEMISQTAEFIVVANKLELGDHTVENFVPEPINLEQPACITFTSGSSGIPKAVVGSHLGLCGYLNWLPTEINLSSSDRFSMLSGLMHDPLQRDIFGALCLGATLVIPAKDDFASFELATWLKQQRISVMHITPTMAEIICLQNSGRLDDLRIVFLTGEPLRLDTALKLRKLNKKTRIFNCFGATETQRAATYYEFDENENSGSILLSSTHTQDTRLRIISAAGQDCGLGEVGEICTESHHVAGGYFNDRELTRKKFIQLGDGLKRYCTGDLGIYCSEHAIKYLGRADSQVNIRGFRVELGDIEYQINTLSLVETAAVVVHDNNFIVAYIIPSKSGRTVRLFEKEVEEKLGKILPEYMIPYALICLAAMPLTENGKIDRKKLLSIKPEIVRREFVEPTSDLEVSIAVIWAKLLKLSTSDIGVLDNFFDLGGHSLLLVRLIADIRRLYEVDISIKVLFQCENLRSLALLVDVQLEQRKLSQQLSSASAGEIEEVEL